MTRSAPINRSSRGKFPIKRSIGSKVGGISGRMSLQQKRFSILILESSLIVKSSVLPHKAVVPPKQIFNFDLNLPRVKFQNSTVVDMLAVFDTFKVYEDKKPRIKKEPQPVKHHAPVNLSAPLLPQPPQPPPPTHQDLYLDFAGGASSLVLTGCQQCHMYVMTLPGNNKCPICFERNLKEFRTLEREAAKRDAARRIRLDLSL